MFTEAEASPDRDVRLAVLSHAFWMRRLLGDPGAIGRMLDLNGERFVVIGVLSADDRPVIGALDPSVYVLVSAQTLPNIAGRENGSNLRLLGRRRDGVTMAQAQAAVTALGIELERAVPKENAGFGRPARVASLRGLAAPQEIFLLPILLAFFFGLLLLIAYANVAGLLLARAASRRRDVAVCLALGASGWRVMQVMLAESLVLALLGAAAGLPLGSWIVTGLGPLLLPGGPTMRLAIVPDATLMTRFDHADDVRTFDTGTFELMSIGRSVKPFARQRLRPSRRQQSTAPGV